MDKSDAKEFHPRTDKILGAPLVLKSSDSKKYTQLSFKPSVAPKLILKRFKMPEILKYDRTLDRQEYITTYTIAVKGNDLDQHKIESVMLKQFKETLMRGALA